MRRAIVALASIPGVTLSPDADVASLYETTPVGGPPGQPCFFNSVARIATRLAPKELLRELLALEASLGRTRANRWDRRLIDLDLLLYDGLTLDSDGLTIPHPRLHERRFVLEPLSELAPELVHPVLKRCIFDLAVDRRCRSTNEQVLRLAGPGWPLASIPIVHDGPTASILRVG